MGMILGVIREETPKYDLVTRIGDLEVRRYGAQYVASVMSSDVPGCRTRDEFQSKAFRMLARYIGVFSTPDNTKAEPIAMTAPVLMTSNETLKAESEPMAMTAPVIMKDSGGPVDWSMSFILPSKYIKSGTEPPTPKNPAVKVSTLPPRLLAVKTFSWNLNQSNIQANLEKALETMESHSSEFKIIFGDDGAPAYEVFGFNPPWTLPWWKTNEVAILLREQCASDLAGVVASKEQASSVPAKI